MLSLERKGRFKGAIWFEEILKESAIIGGAGGTGSFLTFFLARTGISCLVYDNDSYEVHNISGQLCDIYSVGKKKVFVLKGLVEALSGEHIMTKNQLFTENSENHYIMFACFDSFKARQIMFDSWVRHVNSLNKNSEEYKKAIFIDLRCSVEVVQIVTITPDKIEEYKNYIWDDDSIEAPVCTYKQTSHCASLVSSMATSIFTNHIANYVLGEKVYSVPLYWEYYLNTNECNIK